MAELVRCADRWGREIVLYEDTWYDKIVADHGEVANSLDAIAEVLANPDRVNFDALFPNGENFYGRGYLGHPFGRRYLKVVVRFETFESEENGTIVSVFPASSYRKDGEQYKWHRP